MNLPRLRHLDAATRLGLTALLAVFAMGLVASAIHLVGHYEKRDGVDGFTMDDLAAAYHGLEAPALLVASLESGHPESLASAQRASLLAWLRSDRVVENFDSLDLGDEAPAEIIAAACLSCHARGVAPPPGQEAARSLPLDYWDDVKRIAFPRSVPATPRDIVLTSMHAHAPAMATMSVVIAALALATGFSRRLVGALIAVSGMALLLDFASWLAARRAAEAVYAIAGAGAVYHLATGLLLLLVLLELWRPRPGAKRDGSAA